MSADVILDAKLSKPEVKRAYTNIARVYDAWAALTETKARRTCLELANIRDGERVLEVAVGTGLAFTEILKKNPQGITIGIDLTEAMLLKALERAPSANGAKYLLALGDAFSLPCGDSTFDVLINNYMLDLVPEKDFPMVLDEFKRVLRPGGRLVLVGMTKPEHWYNGLWEIIYRIKPSLLGGCRGLLLEGYVRRQGFERVERHFISQFTFPSEIVYGLKP